MVFYAEDGLMSILKHLASLSFITSFFFISPVTFSSPLDTYLPIFDTRCMTPDEMREDVELKIVEFLKEKLESGEITEVRAQQISVYALKTLRPGMSLEELYKAIAKLDDSASELSVIVLPYIEDYENNVTSQALNSVRELIKQGQYDAAVKLGKKAATSDVELEWSGEARSNSAGQGSGKVQDS